MVNSKVFILTCIFCILPSQVIAKHQEIDTEVSTLEELDSSDSSRKISSIDTRNIAEINSSETTSSIDDDNYLTHTKQAGISLEISNYKSDHANYLDIPAEKLLIYVNDPENRIDSLFKTPKALRSMVSFWFLVYVKYSLYQTLIYDKENPSLIYAVVDSNDLFQRGKSPVVIELTTKKRIQKTLADVKNVLQQLAANPKKTFKIHSLGSRIKALCGPQNASSWKLKLNNLRTQAGQRDKVLEGVRASGPFIPAMEKVFQKFNLPTELTRIPLLESSFNLNAISKANAVGVWQFLEKSAKEYLVVDKINGIDERLSPVKSAYAAAKMFKRNYKILQDYALAIIAYNHGIRNLISIKHKYKGAKIVNLLNLRENSPLGYASRNYYAEFLAILHAEEYKDKVYGISRNEYSGSVSIIKTKKPLSIYELSSKYNIPIFDLKKFNPDIFDIKHKLPVGTKVVLPKKVGESLVMVPTDDAKQKQDASPSSAPRSPASTNDFYFIEYIH